MNIIKQISSILFLLSFLTLNGQTDFDFKFKTYTVNEGLIHNRVNKTVMDQQGFLWIATEGGLSRFDGVTFTNFKNELPFSDIKDIEIGNDGRLWMCGAKGLFTFNVLTQQILTFPNKLCNTNILKIELDEKNQCTWFYNLTNQKLCKLNWKNEKVDTLGLKKIEFIHDIFLYKNKIILAEDRKGILIYDIQKTQLKQYYHNIWPVRIKTINNELWVSSWQDDLFKYNENQDSFYRFNIDVFDHKNPYKPIVLGIEGINFSKNNYLLLGFSTGAGLGIYDIKNKTLKQEISKNIYAKNGIQSNFVENILKDNYGNFWISTWHGLAFINLEDQQFITKEIENLDVNGYNCLDGMVRDKKDKNIVWWGVNGQGIIKFNEKTKKVVNHFFKYELNSNENNYDYLWTEFIQIAPNNCVWSGGYAGLVKIEKDQPSVYDFGGNKLSFVKNLYMQNDETFWVSSLQTGLVKFNPKTGTFKSYVKQNSNIGSNGVQNVIPADNGNLWVCTLNDVLLFNPKTEQFTPQNIQFKGQKIDKIENFEIDQFNTFYISNNNGTYFKTKNTNEFKEIKYTKSIIPIYQHSLIIDKNNHLWIYSVDGLFCFNSKTNTVSRYDQKDGIYNISSDPTRLYEFENDIYIGYRMAYTKFNPLLLNISKTKPIPFITSIKFNGKNGNINNNNESNPLEISYKDNVIDITYTAINYTFAEKTKFYYKLDGFDEKWIFADNKRQVRYTNLNGGKYVFKLKAISHNGINSEKILSFYIKIIPPFWQTWWFKLLFILFVLSVIYIIYRIRIGIIRKEEKTKTAYNKQIAELESKALRSQMNPHFVFNSLNSIQNYIVKNDMEASSKYLSKFAKLTRLIFDHSQQQFITLNQELKALKTYVELEQFRFSNQFEFTIKIDENVDEQSVEIPPLIIQPFVENAIWHGIMHRNFESQNSVGKISIDIHQKNDYLQIIITDNGIGREKSASLKNNSSTDHQSSGMRLTKERLDILNKNNQLEITSKIIDLYDENKEACGTQVIINIPLN